MRRISGPDQGPGRLVHMIYSGADLIRTSGQSHERLERLNATESVAPVSAAKEAMANLDQETSNALLRFARFVHDESERKKKKPKKEPHLSVVSDGAERTLSSSIPSSQNENGARENPYMATWSRGQQLLNVGQLLDIFA